MPPIAAVVFDLYGTLIRVGDRRFPREVPRLLGADTRRWMDLVRGPLLNRSFPDRAAFTRFICHSLSPGCAPDVEARCADVLDREMASVVVVEGAVSLLAFLKRRGYALGLVSNVSSAHKDAVAALGLDQFFSAMVFSCDEGMCKPDPRIYRQICARLDAAPEAVLVVGDSRQNDVEAPIALGMRGLHVSARGPTDGVRALSDLGWVSLAEGRELEPLIADGVAIDLGGARGALRGLTPLSDTEGGRYNLVARARLETEGDDSTPVFCKRYLMPESAFVEEFAHHITALVGMSSCSAVVVDGPEPCLVISRAPGTKLEGKVNAALSYEAGRHCAFGYLFANADLRPRNAFLSYRDGRPVITMVDLEHCFFNLALDTSGLGEPGRPETFDRMDTAEIARRLKKRVLTPLTTRRARRTFVETEGLDTELAAAFRRGWIDLFHQVQARRDAILARIDERVHRPPYLIIGTQSYRRAMATVDVKDIAGRIGQDPEVNFPVLF